MTDELSELFADVIQRKASGETYEILDDYPVTRPTSGKIAGRACMVTEMYYPDGHTLDVRLRAAKAMDYYFGIFRDEITHYVAGGERSIIEIKNHQLPDLSEDARTRTPTDMPDLSFSPVILAFKKGDVSSYEAATLGMNKYKMERYSFIEASAPFRWAKQDHFRPMIDLVTQWATIMRPDFGLAGPGVRTESIASDGRLLFPLLQMVPGLEYVDPTNVSLAFGSERAKIKGMNWLTVLHDRFVSMLGGLSTVRAAVEPACTIRVYDGGIILQAGPQPEFGDVNLRIVPDAYRKVAQLVDPLIFDSYGREGLFYVPNTQSAPEAAAKWVHRFSQPTA